LVVFTAINDSDIYAVGYQDGIETARFNYAHYDAVLLEWVGYDEGYNYGYDYGYDLGYYEGIENAEIGSFEWFTILTQGTANLFSIKIFPGFELGYAVGFAIAFGFLRYFLSHKK